MIVGLQHLNAAYVQIPAKNQILEIVLLSISPAWIGAEHDTAHKWTKWRQRVNGCVCRSRFVRKIYAAPLASYNIVVYAAEMCDREKHAGDAGVPVIPGLCVHRIRKPRCTVEYNIGIIKTGSAACRALFTLWAGRALRPLFTLRALFTLWTSRALFTLRAWFTLWALFTLWTGRTLLTLWPLKARFTLWASRTLRALFALWSRLTVFYRQCLYGAI